MSKKLELPADLLKPLLAIGQRLYDSDRVEAELPGALAALATLPAANISALAKLIADTARLGYPRRPPFWLCNLVRPQLTDQEQLVRQPGLAHLFVFHPNGRVREAALHRLSGPLPSPFALAAIAMRLNDWALPVRKAAMSCASRCLPVTSPEIIAEASCALLVPTNTWQRWGTTERAMFEGALARPDVVDCLFRTILRARTGPMASTLSLLLRTPALDHALERLATQATQPAVRAVALRVIADARAIWPVGKGWRWIDKSMGHGHRVTTYASRDIAMPLPSAAVVERSLSDRSAIVRNAALAALIRHRLDTAEAKVLAAPLQHDPSRAVRERASFILRRNPHAGSDDAG